MKGYPLTNRDRVLFLLVCIAGYVFTEVQQYFIPEGIRPFTYLPAVFLLLLRILWEGKTRQAGRPRKIPFHYSFGGLSW